MKSTKRVEASPENRFADLRHNQLNEAEKASVVRLSLEVLAARHAPGRTLSSPNETREYLRLVLAGYKNEVFGALFLDNRHRVLVFEELFFGTIDGTAIYPRVVVQRSLELNAAAVIFTHNHERTGKYLFNGIYSKVCPK